MYSLVKAGGVSVVMGELSDGNRYRFKSGGRVVKFKQAGGRIFATVAGSVAVYRKPHPATYHREYMRANGLAMYRGLSGTDPEQLLDNMLEYVETLE